MSGLKQGQKNGKIDTLQQKLISDQMENLKKQKNELQKKMRKQYENNELIFSDVNSFNKDVNFNHPNNIALLNTNNNWEIIYHPDRQKEYENKKN